MSASTWYYFDIVNKNVSILYISNPFFEFNIILDLALLSENWNRFASLSLLSFLFMLLFSSINFGSVCCYYLGLELEKEIFIQSSHADNTKPFHTFSLSLSIHSLSGCNCTNCRFCDMRFIIWVWYEVYYRGMICNLFLSRVGVNSEFPSLRLVPDKV